MTQNLSPTARRMKAIRDKRMAMTADRKAKKAENQRKRRSNPSAAKGKDYDHKTSSFKTVKANRGNDGVGTKSESGKKYTISKSPVKKADKKLLEAAKKMAGKEQEELVIKQTAKRGLTKKEKDAIKKLKEQIALAKKQEKERIQRKKRLDDSLKNNNKQNN